VAGGVCCALSYCFTVNQGTIATAGYTIPWFTVGLSKLLDLVILMLAMIVYFFRNLQEGVALLVPLISHHVNSNIMTDGRQQDNIILCFVPAHHNYIHLYSKCFSYYSTPLSTKRGGQSRGKLS